MKSIPFAHYMDGFHAYLNNAGCSSIQRYIYLCIWYEVEIMSDLSAKKIHLITFSALKVSSSLAFVCVRLCAGSISKNISQTEKSASLKNTLRAIECKINKETRKEEQICTLK